MGRSGKEKLLRQKIAERGSMLVAFSGGTDSALIGALARDVLGEKSACALLDSPLVPRSARAEAERIARDLGLSLTILPLPVLQDMTFSHNPADRCYHCRQLSARILKGWAEEIGLSCVADGSNCSDLEEFRPGLRAMSDAGFVHPFIEAGMTKEEIRALAKRSGYPFWDKPSAPCLATRLPYGEEITAGKLGMIEEAEACLAGWGFSEIRVRMHGKIARIEVSRKELAGTLQVREDLVRALKEIGFSYVTLDLEGYRIGSMDRVP